MKMLQSDWLSYCTIFTISVYLAMFSRFSEVSDEYLEKQRDNLIPSKTQRKIFMASGFSNKKKLEMLNKLISACTEVIN